MAAEHAANAARMRVDAERQAECQARAAFEAEEAAIAQAEAARKVTAEAAQAALVRAAAETATERIAAARLRQERELIASIETRRAELQSLPAALRRWWSVLQPYSATGTAVVCAMVMGVVMIGALATAPGALHSVPPLRARDVVATCSSCLVADDGVRLKLTTTLAGVD